MATKKKQYSSPFLRVKKAPLGRADVNLSVLAEALVFHKQGELDKAQEIYMQLIEIDNSNAEAIYFLGLIAQQKGNHESAIELILMAIKLKPDDPVFYFTCADSQLEVNKLNDALTSYNRGIQLDCLNFHAYYNRGRVLRGLDKFEEAVASYDKAIELNPELTEAYYNRGNALKDLKFFEEAVKSYDKALKLSPNLVLAHLNRGVALKELKLFEDALKSYDNAIELKPNYSDAFSNRGVVFLAQLKFEDAVNQFQKAIVHNPVNSDAHYNLGNALMAQKYLIDAVASYKSAIELKSEYYEAHLNLGNVLFQLGEYEESVMHYETAHKINPEIDLLHGTKLQVKMFLCDWGNLDENLLLVKSFLNKKRPVASPFLVLNLLDNPELQMFAAEQFTELKQLNEPSLPLIPKRDISRRLRIGYFSADLNYHPASIWLAEQIESHDKSKFELFAFCLKSVPDLMQDRLRQSFDHWIEVERMSDLSVAKLSRELMIDIALDMNGHTLDSRPGIFAERAAPIQVSHLGYPGTMGSKNIDYMFLDKHLVTETSINYFVEKIAYLPCGYTYDRKRLVSKESLTRSQFGLLEDNFVFTCQNGSQKFVPEVFDVWMDLLKAVPNSVLWLQEPNSVAIFNLRKEALSRGIECNRLVFTKREKVSRDQEKNRIARYLASYQLADLFLDTWPYNAGTTAVDALWAGLPVLTKAGESVASRMAASVLHAIEMPELITNSIQQYREMAIALATNSEHLRQIKDKLEKNRLKTALFNTESNVRYIEKAYLEMYRRYQEALQPEDFEID